jgi:hypothetical protein
VEEANVVGAIETIVSAMERVGCRYEILVSDDGWRDNTSAVVACHSGERLIGPRSGVNHEDRAIVSPAIE